jgi:hypothetical protein
MKHLLLLSSILFVVFSCHKYREPGKPDPNENLQPVVSSSTPSGSCEGNYSGSYTAPGNDPVLYIYPLEPLDISCAENGATVTVYASPIDVPNRFTIVDQNNNFVAASGSGSYSYWVGDNCIGGPCFSGPWGGSNIPPPYNSGPTSFTFTKTANTNYFLRVEAYIPHASYQHRTDGWSVSISCTCGEGGCEDGCNPCVCGGNNLSGSYTAPGTYPVLYTYPLQLLNLSCAANGATITVYASPIDVPNRFTIVDQNNTFVAASGSGSYSYWVGDNCIAGPCFFGPWGGSNIPPPYNSGPTSFTFTKLAGRSYALKVEGYIPDVYYQHRTDGWSASISCN